VVEVKAAGVEHDIKGVLDALERSLGVDPSP